MPPEQGHAEPRRERKLAAIMFTDMVGFSALTQSNELLALDLIETQSRLIEPIVALHGGRIVRSMGDGLFVEFPSALAACRAAIQIQDAIGSHNRLSEASQQFQIRIGIHVGDVEVRGDDLFGDGVNIAARVEPLAEPGGICITDDVARQVRNKLELALTDIGPQHVKNIAEPIRAHRIGIKHPKPDETDEHGIAVLPFANLSPDPENEHFADGLTDEMIFSLGQVPKLRVASRTSSFAAKGSSKPLREIARAVGADYLLEGSVRRAANRVRVTAQLIDVAKDRAIWSEKFDRDLSDIFEIQDEITASIVSSLRIAISEASGGRTGVPTQSMDAYDAFLRGQTIRQSYGPPSEAADLFEQAVTLDPNFVRAWASLAEILTIEFQFYGGGADTLTRAQDAARRAVALDSNSSEGYGALAEIAVARGEFEEADRLFPRAIQLDPRAYRPHYLWAHSLKMRGLFESAIEQFEITAGLRQDDYSSIALTIDCYDKLGKREEARRAAFQTVERVQRRLLLEPNEARAWYLGAQAWLHLGDPEKAGHWGDKALALEPNNTSTLYNVACVHSRLANHERAFELLDRAVELGHDGVLWMTNDPDLDPLRGDPRMASLIARMQARLTGKLDEVDTQ